MRKISKSDKEVNISAYNRWSDTIQPIITSIETPGAYSALWKEVREIGNRIYSGECFATTQALVDHVHTMIRRCKQGYYSHVSDGSWYVA